MFARDKSGYVHLYTIRGSACFGANGLLIRCADLLAGVLRHALRLWEARCARSARSGQGERLLLDVAEQRKAAECMCSAIAIDDV